jgi:hypothetical protein
MLKNTVTTLSVALLFSVGMLPLTAFAQGQPTSSFHLPANAKKVSDTVYDLGYKKDPSTGKDVHGYAFVTPRGNAQKSNNAGGRPGGGTTASTCYSLLASGLKWKSSEPWVIDASGSGLDATTVYNHLSGDLQTWETAAVSNIFGNGTQGSNLSAEQSGAPDGSNEILFGNIAEAGVIAVTITWGIYSGPTKAREIVEWDQIYDNVDFNWSLTGESGKMDFDNIATHETGHAAGLGHPANTCTDETMYAYADFGETNKRTLGAGDIVGINVLY